MTNEERRLDKEDMDILDDLYKAYDDGYAQGRVDVIEECIDVLNNSIPLVDNMDVIFGFKCAVERLEQLKEQK